MSLAAVFREAAVEDLTVPRGEELERRLEALVRGAREAHPEVEVSGEALVLALARSGCPLPEDAADAYLALGAASGQPRAIERFRQVALPRARAALRRMKLAGPDIDDLLARVEANLLVGDPPRIVAYAGRGPLSGLAIVAATRLALKQLRPAPTVPVDPPESQDSPELELLKARYRAQLKEAFEQSLGKLTSRERNLLRLQLVDGLSIDAIGALFNVHRATAARWLAAARERAGDQVRRLLTENGAVPAGELDSLTRLVASQIDLSLRRLLGSAPSTGSG